MYWSWEINFGIFSINKHQKIIWLYSNRLHSFPSCLDFFCTLIRKYHELSYFALQDHNRIEIDAEEQLQVRCFASGFNYCQLSNVAVTLSFKYDSCFVGDLLAMICDRFIVKWNHFETTLSVQLCRFKSTEKQWKFMEEKC